MSVDSISVASLYVLVVPHAVATAVLTPALTEAIPSLVSQSQYTASNFLYEGRLLGRLGSHGHCFEVYLCGKCVHNPFPRFLRTLFDLGPLEIVI